MFSVKKKRVNTKKIKKKKGKEKKSLCVNLFAVSK